MTAVDTSPLYSRNPRVLWRDTGQHVVVLPLDGGTPVATILSGGSAVVWRLLDRARRVPDLVAELDSAGVSPSEGEVVSAIDLLAQRGLVAETQGGD